MKQERSRRQFSGLLSFFGIQTAPRSLSSFASVSQRHEHNVTKIPYTDTSL